MAATTTSYSMDRANTAVGAGGTSSAPDSFKLDRKSPLATQLMEAVAIKLNDFIGNYQDDVLAEYVVVLVCNGKTRNQAREDLDAFLEENSGPFVDWLWEHVSRCISSSEKPANSLSFKEQSAADIAVNGKFDDSSICKKQPAIDPVSKSNADKSANNRRGQLPHRDAGGPQNQKADCELDSVHGAVSSGTGRIETFDRWCPEQKDSLVVRGKVESGLSHDVPVQSKSYDGQILGSRGHLYDMKDPAEFPLDVKTNICSSQLADQKNKMNSSYDKGHGELPNKGLNPRNMQSMVVDSSIRGATRLAEALPPKNARSRGTVWDRLGVPRGKYQKPERYDRNTTNPALESVVEEHVAAGDRFHDEDISGRKRKYLEEGISANNAEPTPVGLVNEFTDLRRSLSGKNRRLQSNDMLLSDETSNSRLHEATGKLPKLLTSSHKVESENVTPITPEGSAEVEDVKMRLQKLEKEITKLRPKESETDSDGLPPVTSGQSQGQPGASHIFSSTQNNSEADFDSRTVFVSNVHFAASMEALSSHFSRCGGVARVTLLTDPVTGQPKGCAYVVFLSIESIDKALAMSGTSFYSRILKVLHKVDAPRENAGVIQSPMNKAPAYASSQFQRRPLNRQFSGSNIWRRDNTSNSGNTQT